METILSFIILGEWYATFEVNWLAWMISIKVKIILFAGGCAVEELQTVSTGELIFMAINLMWQVKFSLYFLKL